MNTSRVGNRLPGIVLFALVWGCGIAVAQSSGDAMKVVGHKDVAYLEVKGRNHGTVVTRIGEADDPVAKAMTRFVRNRRPR